MRRIFVQFVARMVQRMAILDEIVLHYIQTRLNLFAALIGALLLVWSAFAHNGFLSAEVLLAGAIGYALGFVPAMMGGIFINGLEIALRHGHPLHIPTLLVQFFGCSMIAWLGHGHQMAMRQAREQSRELADVSIRAQIVPWTLVNEVRNSLLAMRLLLFTSKTDRNSDPQNMQLVQAELLRLEALFKELHEKQIEPDTVEKDPKTRLQKNA